jgi:hypothetical protein
LGRRRIAACSRRLPDARHFFDDDGGLPPPFAELTRVHIRREIESNTPRPIGLIQWATSGAARRRFAAPSPDKFVALAS